jgi:hypothetical protein
MRLWQWPIFAAYAAICGILIGVIDVSAPRAFLSLPILLSGLCPIPLALWRGLTRWTILFAIAVVLAVELPTLNLVAGCWMRNGCGETTLEVTLVGFAYLFPLVSLPVTFFLWSFIHSRRRR